MKQQYNQAHPHPNPSEQTALVRQETQISAAPPTLAGLAKNRIMVKIGMTEQEWAIYDAEVSIGLLTLRTAFPTQARNYSDREHDVLTALWLDIFAEIEPGLLREAIMRFISTDRKGFFPAPGQIMGCVEEVQVEREKKAAAERIETHRVYLRELQKRIDNGENCSTCRFSVCREIVDVWDKNNNMGLFCQNPESYKYEGDFGYGTMANTVCEYYEPKSESEAILIE